MHPSFTGNGLTFIRGDSKVSQGSEGEDLLRDAIWKFTLAGHSCASVRVPILCCVDCSSSHYRPKQAHGNGGTLAVFETPKHTRLSRGCPEAVGD